MSNFAGDIQKSENMKKAKPFIGIILIVLGTLTLTATQLKALNGSNWLLLSGLLLIITGIIMHIRIIKSE